MPFPYFQNISTDFTGTWSSARKRKVPTTEPSQPLLHQQGKANAVACPHSITFVRSTRQLVAEKQQCPICLEDYFSTPTPGRDRVAPVKMGCSHVFCRECIETHLSSSTECPLPWCEAHLPLQPDTCKLCAVWQKDHAAPGSLLVTVRASEMASSIKTALDHLATDNAFYKLPKLAKCRLIAHVRSTLKRYEWQFHSGVDVAELLDPFLLAVDVEAAREYYGSKLCAPAHASSQFPPREHDADDYGEGREPWIAAFFRQWALEYEKDNGEVREGWGVWAKKAEQESDCSWDWPYKRIVAHRTGEDGEIEYLVKWVGQRYFASWVKKENVVDGGRKRYDETHGVVYEKDQSKRRRRG